MAEVYASERNGYRLPAWKTDSAIGLLMLLALLIFTALGIEQLDPPKALDSSASPVEFSAARAMKHLIRVASRPHPIGSPDHAEVRNYIVKELQSLGVDTEVQEATTVNRAYGNPFSAGTVHNIVSTLKGKETGKALLIVGHYDSVPTGPGACDDGSAVAMMIETARALKAGEALKNDVIFLFTDGEEVGLLGARAFVEQHAGAKNVGLVLNFDARGNDGPVIMFETSPQNGGLIREFARAAPYPVATSFAYDIYRLLPNNTDFTVFKEADLSGLNFANINGFISYHTQLDSAENMDARTLQHQGSYAVALLRHFGNLPLPIPPERNAVYFNTVGSLFIHYPGSWAIILTAVTALLFAAVVIVGLRRERLKVSGILRGFLSLLLAMVSGGLAGTILWWVVRRIHSDERLMNQSNTYNSYLYMMGFVLLAIALASALYARFRRKASVENLAMGAMLWWLILMMLSTLFLRGSSYLLTWPLLFGLAGLGIAFISKAQRSASWKQFAVFSVSAVPCLLIFAPIIYQAFTALSLGATGIIMVLVVLAVGLLLPQLEIIALPGRWLLPGVMLITGLGFLVAGIVTSGFGATHPQSDSLFYGLDADAGRALWASAEYAPDEWTGQFISAKATRRTLPELFPLGTREYLTEAAPLAPLLAPQAQLLGDSTSNGLRTLRLRITSARQAPYLSVYVEPEVEVVGATVNGQPLTALNAADDGRGDKEWALFYYGTPAGGIELVCTVKTEKPIKLRVVDRSYGLPETLTASSKPKPNYLMPLIMPNNRTTLVSKSFVF